MWLQFLYEFIMRYVFIIVDETKFEQGQENLIFFV